jgi:hypothetical protein
MSQARHILQTDLRRLRWMIVAWLAIRAACVVVDTKGADVALGGFGPQTAVSELSVLLSLVSFLFLALFASRLIHEEPLVGRDAFWITRPIVPGALMAAKLTFAVLLFVVVPLAGDLLVAAYFSTPLRDVGRAVPVYTLNRLLSVVPLIALAALTPSLTRLVAAIVGVIATLVAATAMLMLTALFFAQEAAERGEVRPPDPTADVIGAMLLVLSALAVITYQYRRRRLGYALLLAASGVLLTLVVSTVWPWSFAPALSFETATPPADDRSIDVSLDTSNPRIGDSYGLRRQDVQKTQIAAQALVTGLPPEYTLRTVTARSRLELQDGTALQSPARQANSYVLFGGSALGRRSAVEAALGGARLLATAGPVDLMSELWPTLLDVREDDFVRYRHDAGRLSVELRLLFGRGIERAVLPLADGAARRAGNARLEVVRVIRRPTGCTVLFRRTHVEPLFSRGSAYSDLIFALRNNARHEAVVGESRDVSHRSFTAGSFVFTPQQLGGHGFVLQQYEQEFPARRPDTSAITLDDQWMRDAELVMIEMIPAGAITRSLVVDGFRMTP